MNLKIQITDFGKLAALLRIVKPAGRRRLYKVGTYEACYLVKRHVRKIGFQRHATASRLGAQPTGHFDITRHAIVPRVTGDGGEIKIRIPGIGRARHEITLTTPTSRGRKFLTIPEHPAAYGKTVETLRRRGWKIFRPGRAKILLGYRRKGEKPVKLFALAEQAHFRKDPSLLPTDAEIGNAAAAAMAAEIRRVLAR